MRARSGSRRAEALTTAARWSGLIALFAVLAGGVLLASVDRLTALAFGSYALVAAVLLIKRPTTP